MQITGGNVNDRSPVIDLVKDISAELFEQKVTLISKIKKNMKNYLMDMTDKMMLMRRSFIETIFSSMKLLSILMHHKA